MGNKVYTSLNLNDGPGGTARLTCEFARANAITHRGYTVSYIPQRRGVKIRVNLQALRKPRAMSRQVWPTQPHPGNSKETANRIIHCTCFGSDRFWVVALFERCRQWMPRMSIRDMPWLKMDLGAFKKDLGKLTWSYVRLIYIVFLYFCLALNFVFFAIVMWFWEVPFFPLHVLSLAFDPKMWKVSGKDNVSGELEREKQLRVSVLRKHKKKHVFNTYTFPSLMVMGAGNTNEFPCHFGIHEDTHACSHVFVETHPECRDFWAPCV